MGSGSQMSTRRASVGGAGSSPLPRCLRWRSEGAGEEDVDDRRRCRGRDAAPSRGADTPASTKRLATAL